MGLIQSFLYDLSSIKGLSDLLPLEVEVLSTSGDYKNEEDILKRVIRHSDRFTGGCMNEYMTVRVSSKKQAENRVILYFTLSEYPSCCGKLILHSIYFPGMYFSYDGNVNMLEEDGSVILSRTLKFISEIADIMKYSTLDFIISDFEQPFLLKSAKGLGLKEISVFKNRRNDYKHSCYTYSIIV